MKKLLTLCLGFIPCAALAATNKISMVTFFPVPYVAYSQLKATDQMDIGLTNSCDMTLGCSEESATLNATQVNVKGGKLNLDGGRGIKGNTLSLGNGNGEGKISFQNVRIQTGNMESMNAQGMKASNLNLFGKAFPSCKDANSASSGQMQWTSLKLKGADSKELYLACGNVAEAAGSCSDRTYKLANKSVCCPSIPYTDSDCWKAVPVPETWTWGSPTTITNHSCTGVFFVTTEKPSYWGDATSWCVDKSRIKRVSSPVEGVDDLTFTVAAASGGNCTIKQPGRTSCYENEAYFSNAERTFASAGMNFSCTISGTKCTCTFNAWAGVPCVKSSSASTSYQPNGW